jgi:scyllo-inositol 2-dehydrogenase (NADP+)
MSNTSINVGLIGFGMAGQVFHAPIIVSVPGLHLYKIRESRPENIALANQRFPGAQVVPEVNDLFNDPAIGLIVVATSNTSHFDLTKRALEAGKHVLVEKPFTITSADADQLIALANKHKKVLTVHHNRRFDGDFSTIRKVLKEGLLGRVVEMEIHYDRFRNFLRPNAWREEDLPGSGILFDLGSHLIDQVLTLFGMPLEVSAFTAKQRTGSKTVDNFEVILHYNGLKATLKAGMLVREQGPRFSIHGEKGTFIKYGIDVQEEALKAGKIPSKTPHWGIEPESDWAKVNTDFNGMHLVTRIETDPGNYPGLYANVRDAINGVAPLEVTAKQSRDVIRIIELATQSADEKRTVKVS